MGSRGLSVDFRGHWVAALPAGRPVREISIYDFSQRQVRRLLDADPEVEYSSVAIDRAGATVFAIRRWIHPDRYADIVAIDIQSGHLSRLNSRAASFAGIAAAADNSLYYLRDVDDRSAALESLVTSRRVPAQLDLSGVGEFQQLANITGPAGSEKLVTDQLFNHAMRLSATTRFVQFATNGVHPDFPLGAGQFSKGSVAGQRYLYSGYAGPEPRPSNYSGAGYFLVRAPVISGVRGPLHLGDLRRAIGSDITTDVVILCSAGEANCGDAHQAEKEIGLELDAAPNRLALIPHQFSDDGQTIFHQTRGFICWGDQSRRASCKGLAAKLPPTTAVDADLSHDGSLAVVLEEAKPSSDRPTLRWCLLASGHYLDECGWISDATFGEKAVSIHQ